MQRATLYRMTRGHADLPRVLAAREARLMGLSRAAVRHGVDASGWQLLVRGIVLTTRGEPTRDDWIQAGLKLGSPRAALSGWDALRTRGVGARMPPSPDVLILDRGGAHRRMGHAVLRPTRRRYATTMLPSEHPSLPFVPVVDPARAVTDTALMHQTFAPVRAMVTASVQRGLCRPEDLVAEYEHCPRQGSQWLRQALDDVMNGAKSIAEAEAVDYLTRARVPDFEVNVPIVDRHGCCCSRQTSCGGACGVILEVDSREFHFSEDDWKATTRRHTFLTRRGFAVEHHAPSDIRSGAAIWAADVAAGLRVCAAELGLTYGPGCGPAPAPAPAGGHRPVVLQTERSHLLHA